MAGVDLGRVAYVPKGAYDALATYSRLDVVSYQGGSFVSLIDNNTGNTPVAGVNWALVAAKGDKGDKGDKGATGAQGVKGDTGAIGPQGPKGDTGPIGPQGVVGDTGAVGPRGPKGDTGAKGDKGDKGDTGATGSQGLKGEKGDQGIQGIQGIQGVNGDKGDTGQNGVISVDAPADGKTYGRKNEDWAEVVIPETKTPFIPIAVLSLYAQNSSNPSAITSEMVSTAIGGIDNFNKIYDAIDKGAIVGLGEQSADQDVNYFVNHECTAVQSVYNPEEGKAIVFQNTFMQIQWAMMVMLSLDNVFSLEMSSMLPVPVTGDANLMSPVIIKDNGTGNKCLSDNGRYVDVIAPTTVTTATTLTGLSIANYSIKVTLSGASALSFASIPPEGWECMIDIKNTGSSAITQPLPNATGWQSDASMTIAAGKIASISVRYVHGVYVVVSKGD